MKSILHIAYGQRIFTGFVTILLLCTIMSVLLPNSSTVGVGELLGDFLGLYILYKLFKQLFITVSNHKVSSKKEKP